MRVVATAGHVDHGKSSLVERLTGINPDRFEEERRRGLTIDLGFAHTTLPSGAGISFVDVPGHERFLANALAGLGGVGLVLLVVAADEGVRAQTREHLAVAELLGVPDLVVALTKIDLAGADAVDLGVFSRRNGIFEFEGENAQVRNALVNWGIGAVVYLVVGRVLDRIVRP